MAGRGDTSAVRISEERPRVVVAGASGAIGRAVCRALVPDHEVTVLTRSPTRARHTDPRVPLRRKHCDLYCLEDVGAALSGFDYAIYLVDNLTPSSRLNQATCRDLDVLCADNFGRAAQAAGIRQIVHLGVLVPQGDVPEDLVRSRVEVSAALGAHGTPVTTLRAGLIVARGGTFARVVADLASRPPFILLPSWANGRKQPVALGDVVRAIRVALGNPATHGQELALGGPRVLTVRDILERTTRLLGARRKIVRLPWIPPFLYRAWTRFFARDLHPELARMLVASLRYDALAADAGSGSRPEQAVVSPRASIWEAMRDTTDDEDAREQAGFREIDDARLRAERRVRSIQRLELPPGRDAAWVADHYFEWLPRFMLGVVGTERWEPDGVQMVVRGLRLPIIRLRRLPEASSPDRRVYQVAGGALARVVGGDRARLEFRQVLGEEGVLAALQDFQPSLPWRLYVLTQATVHLVTMRAYQRHLRRVAGEARGAAEARPEPAAPTDA